MALISGSKSKEGSPGRRLGDHLREQQEPFVLEVYLRERGCTRKRINSYEATSGCFFSSKCSSTRKSTDAAKGCSKIAKSLCNKLVLKGSGVDDDGGEEGRKKEEEESERLSFASMSTEFNSMSDIEAYLDCVENRAELSHQQDQSVTDKQYSPDSVLDEIQPSPVYEIPSTPRSSCLNKPTEDGVLSTSLIELLARSGREVDGGSCSGYRSSKRALQQSRQLLFDCVREVVEKQRKTEQHLMGTEEVGMVICENMRVWSRGADNKKKTTRLLRLDLRQSFEEWECFDEFTRAIEKEVGDWIFEELEDELVEDLVSLNDLAVG